jgi:hypothetical protein
MRKVTEITHKSNPTRAFLFPTEDMVIHIITTGFSERQKYMVVYEDAYQTRLGETEMLSGSEIKEKFNIIL